jgi:Ran GTPase-activating protein (RanGAP) involved in mRNA processing and transport
LNLGDNQIEYHGSRFLAQGLKENTSLIDLNLKLNRIDDKGGLKLCVDLLNHKGLILQNLDISSNALGKQFCENFAELIKFNSTLRKIDISCNFIDESNPSTLSTLKDALRSNPRIIELDIRNNQLSEDTEDEIREIITKNKLESQGIPFEKLAECKNFHL